MNWIAQVRHVAVKDVRQGWWLLLVYVAMVSVAAASVVTRRALGPYSTGPSSETLGMPDIFVVWLPAFIIILGLLSTASLLHADSPTRANAFWASRPLSPSAVLAAKLVVVATAVVALPLVGGLTALESLDTSPAAATSVLARAALSYGEWTLAVMVIGALTDDIRGFVSAFVGVLAAMIVLLGVLDITTVEWGAFGPAVLLLISVGGGVALMAFLYRTRHRGLRTWIAGVAAMVCLVTASFMTPSLHDRAMLLSSAGPPVEVEPLNPSAWREAQRFAMRFRVAQGPDSERLDFHPIAITLRLHDGKDVHVNGSHSDVLVRRVVPPVGHPVRWINDPTNPEWPTVFTAQPNFDFERPSIARDIRSVAVNGTVTVSRPRVVATLPLRKGATVTRDGRRVAIYGFRHDSSVANVWVQLSFVARPAAVPEPNRQLSEKDGLQFAIVNEAHAEAMLIDGGVEGGSGSIVLPWINVSTMFMGLSTRTSQGSTGVPRDDAWYAGAQLVIVEWNVVGRYPARGEATLP
jgi:hypothetical protein